MCQMRLTTVQRVTSAKYDELSTCAGENFVEKAGPSLKRPYLIGQGQKFCRGLSKMLVVLWALSREHLLQMSSSYQNVKLHLSLAMIL